jgi:hypothetical protein
MVSETLKAACLILVTASALYQLLLLDQTNADMVLQLTLARLQAACYHNTSTGIVLEQPTQWTNNQASNLLA